MRYATLTGLTLAAGCGDAAPSERRGPAPVLQSTDREGNSRSDTSTPGQEARKGIPDTVQPRPARAAAAVVPAPSAKGPRRIVFGYMDFTGVGHDRGDPDAPVVVIDLSDFGCPYCGVFARDVFPAIDREYVQTGKVLFKYIPFIAGSFRHAPQATRAAECAAEQGQFWPMVDHLYATQAEWTRGRAIDAQMAALAGTLPLDTATFGRCYADRRTDARTARATQVANSIGVRVTPSFLVDGNPVQGALPLAEFRKQIETALLLKAARAGSSSSEPRQ